MTGCLSLCRLLLDRVDITEAIRNECIALATISNDYIDLLLVICGYNRHCDTTFEHGILLSTDIKIRAMKSSRRHVFPLYNPVNIVISVDLQLGMH